MNEIKAVVFDAFGTVVQITEPSQTYQRFFAELLDPPTRAQRDIAMTMNLGLGGLYHEITGEAVSDEIRHYEKSLMEEVGSVREIRGMYMTLMTLQQMGVRTAICSNLAAPYGIPVKAIFSSVIDSIFLSYEMGTFKPNSDMYLEVLAAFKDYHIEPGEILFIGDNDRNDCYGPKSYGMQAMTKAEWQTMAGDGNHFALPSINHVWAHNQKVKKLRG